MAEMIVELVGIDPRNKGAVLMLESVKQRLSQEFPQVTLAVPLSWPAEDRLGHGLWGLIPRRLPVKSPLRLLGLLPRRTLRRLGLVRADQVDVLLDVSGFAYGDYWGRDKLSQRLGEPLRRWKTPDRRVILLPQALGPFRTPGMADEFRHVLRNADLVYVRDDASMAFVKEVSDEGAVRRAPDFTNLLKPSLPARLEHVRGLDLVIPNEKVIRGQPDAVRESYLQFLQLAVDKLRAAGGSVALLIHEGAGDRALAEALNERLATPLPLLDEPSALDTKAVIGAARSLVSSRFHGLVSALSAGVPALACGWTHKYVELMADYGCGQQPVRLDRPDEWEVAVDRFLSDAASAEFRAALASAAQVQKDRSAELWQEVGDLLRSCRRD